MVVSPKAKHNIHYSKWLLLSLLSVAVLGCRHLQPEEEGPELTVPEEVSVPVPSDESAKPVVEDVAPVQEPVEKPAERETVSPEPEPAPKGESAPAATEEVKQQPADNKAAESELKKEPGPAEVVEVQPAAQAKDEPVEKESEPVVPETELRPALMVQAKEFFEQGKYDEALRACIDLAYLDPNVPGLVELRTETVKAMQQERSLKSALRAETTQTGLALDATEKWDMPDTYNAKRFVHANPSKTMLEENPMLAVLEKPVSIHLKGATVRAFIDIIAKDSEINVIADKAVADKGGIDIEVDNVPLGEVFSYFTRNFGVEFNIGKNMIWITPADPKKAPPMQTKIFKLNKGLCMAAADWGATKDPDAIAVLPTKAAVLAATPSYVEEVINKFVPPAGGSLIMLDRNTHTLFAKNTPENLKLVEEIINSLDQTPPQVLIEARFVETTVSDLNELGIQWGLTEGTVIELGGVSELNEIRNTYLEYVSDEQGKFPLGPQGAFGETRLGNAGGSTEFSDAGLNLNYKGVLGIRELNAVLHALEVSGKGRTLSVPRVTTMNNTPAKLRNGTDMRFFEKFKAQAFSLPNRTGNGSFAVTVLMPDGAPTLEELGITLTAVPSVGSDNRTINLLLVPTISKFDQFISYSTSNAVANTEIQQLEVKLPQFTRREIQTRVSVESGQTVVMGGLIDNVSQETVQKIPFLGSIPYVGRFFQDRQTTEEVRNLIIFVTATVISDRGESLLPVRVAPEMVEVAVEARAQPGLLPSILPDALKKNGE